MKIQTRNDGAAPAELIRASCQIDNSPDAAGFPPRKDLSALPTDLQAKVKRSIAAGHRSEWIGTMLAEAGVHVSRESILEFSAQCISELPSRLVGATAHADALIAFCEESACPKEYLDALRALRDDMVCANERMKKEGLTKLF